MKLIISLWISLLICHQAISQDTIQKRIIFIGDAGEINHQQEQLIPSAAQMVIPEKTTALFLGDNIYPRGMGLPGSAEEVTTQNILRSQFAPFRAKNVPVYFIPGNHDWDKMKKQGLEKIRAQWSFLENQKDTLLKMLPINGCPDPEEIVLSDSLVIIAWDSEWWLFPHKKSSDDVECECETEEAVLEKMEQLAYRHQDKTILLAGHHPFQSYGVHGGYYSLKDHIFPLTAVKKNLYIPLPLIGSLYPFLRQTVFLNPEDIPHPAYQSMINRVRKVFDNSRNVIYVSGHDHGLQLIRNQNFTQIVSGSGAKNSFIQKGPHSLFSNPNQGFVVVDFLQNKNTRITFYTSPNNNTREEYSHLIPFKIAPNESITTNNYPSDSTCFRANDAFDKKGQFHRKIFGENYRKEWATLTHLPVIRISEFKGGLHPLQRGGGMQSISLRLADSTGRHWVIRSVNKQSDALLPKELYKTFAQDFLDDATSAQHPYSALMIPPLAKALNIPHSKPIIGVIAPDTALGVYNQLFANTIALVEEREPLGKSDNTLKMLRKVNQDNDDVYKAKIFLKARLLDLLIGDWDRHEDQWRWYDTNSKNSDKDYVGIPRDRDQALRINDGILPKIVSMPFLLPTMQGFGSEIKSVKYSMWKSNFLNDHPKNQFTKKEWDEIVQNFTETITDSVLTESVNRLPKEIHSIRNERILAELKARRAKIPSEMDDYYRFAHRIVDIRVSNKNEKITVEDTDNKGLRILVRKINKDGEITKKIMDTTYDPSITKEIRIYLSEGNDSIFVKAPTTQIKLRIIGGNGSKNYQIDAANQKIPIYDTGIQSSFNGNTKYFRTYIRSDSSHTAFVPVDLYNVWIPKAVVGYNLDDGILLGTGFKYVHKRGFRKEPFAHIQELAVSVSAATGAVRAKYNGHWKDLFGKVDFTTDLTAFLPTSQNFYGLGNNSVNNKELHIPKYYRTRFSLIESATSLLWNPNETTLMKVGPLIQFYFMDPEHNEGRFIKRTELLKSYDSLTIHKEKLYGGFSAKFEKDNRDNQIIPTRGGYFKSEIKGLVGLNTYARSVFQATSEMAIYGRIAGDAIVIANRIGGGITLGNPAFFQALYLGGQGNLRGYRQFRFAGEHLLYNNLELRIKLAQIGSYILPGQLGLLAAYDVGKVWVSGQDNHTLHQGTGMGFYFSPAKLTLIQAIAAYSREGWHPYVSIGFRF